MTATRHTGAPHGRQDTLIGMRNCLEFLSQEAKSHRLTLTQWLLRMAIASLDEEMTAEAAPSERLDLVAASETSDLNARDVETHSEDRPWSAAD